MTEDFPRRAVELAQAAAAAAGIDPAGAVILRAAAAVTIELPAAGVVARVEAPGDLDAARRQVAAASLLEQWTVPAVRLVAGLRQPLLGSAGIVTFWQRLELARGAPGPAAIGRLARRLHDACAEPLPPELPDLDPFQPIPGWLGRRCDLPSPPGAELLWEQLDRLRAAWPEVLGGDPLGTVLVHGDLNADNIAQTGEGPVLLDLEMAGRGPASWDLIAQETAMRRYGGPPEAYRSFCAAYGAELPDWEGVELLRRAYELNLVSWAVGHRDLSPEMAEQAVLRLDGFLGDGERPWTLV